MSAMIAKFRFVACIRKYTSRFQMWMAAFLLRGDYAAEREFQRLDGEEFLDDYFPLNTSSRF
jgi:hypothetical protein